MTAERIAVSADWLAMREPADAVARAAGLVSELQQQIPNSSPIVIHDLGCGTGSMMRWLAPRLAGRQHWVMHDHDQSLLDRIASSHGIRAADGEPVSFETRSQDICRLSALDVSDATVVTASALLDILTADEVAHIVRLCVDAECAVLMTLSVIGRVTLDPADPLDGPFMTAFNEHQRRTVMGRSMLGPDAVRHAARLLIADGLRVTARPSAWRLDAAWPMLADEWLTGWVEAAVEQRPQLARESCDYLSRRRDQLHRSSLRITVLHEDMLAHRVRRA